MKRNAMGCRNFKVCPRLDESIMTGYKAKTEREKLEGLEGAITARAVETAATEKDFQDKVRAAASCGASR